MTIIRATRQSDAAALSDLARNAYAHYVARMNVEPAPMNEDYSALVKAGVVWVAERDGMLAGLLVLKVRPDHLLLDNVAVSPDAQGMGIGARLLDFADSHARERGLPEVRLYTNEAMTENLAYYPSRVCRNASGHRPWLSPRVLHKTPLNRRPRARVESGF